MEIIAHHTLAHTLGMSAINLVVGSLLAVAVALAIIKMYGGDQ